MRSPFASPTYLAHCAMAGVSTINMARTLQERRMANYCVSKSTAVSSNH